MSDNGTSARARALRRCARLALVALFLGAGALLFVERVPKTYGAGAFLGVCALILAVRRLAPQFWATPKPRVEIDAQGVRRMVGARSTEAVRWAELVKVTIVTTNEGPFTEDFFWLLHAADGSGCVVPHEQACELDLLARLQRLPGFDNLALVEASGSTEHAEFLCWEGPPGAACAEPPRSPG